MRTSLFLLSAVLLTAACNDAPGATGPRSRANATPAADVLAAPASYLPPGPSASGKPAAPFTTVFTVESPVATISPPAFYGWTAMATCPAGSTLIGGGYRVLTGYMDFHVSHNEPSGQNGWRVTGYTSVASATFVATAICIK